jgi:hypothetical protein
VTQCPYCLEIDSHAVNCWAPHGGPERYAFRLRKFMEEHKDLAWDAMVRLILQVAADEREECAKLAENGHLNAKSIAAAIRARSCEEPASPDYDTP